MEMCGVHSLHQPPAGRESCRPRARAAWGGGTQLECTCQVLSRYVGVKLKSLHP